MAPPNLELNSPTSTPPQPETDPKPELNLNALNVIYLLNRTLCGEIALIQIKQSKKIYACKIMKKHQIIENSDIEALRREKRILLLGIKNPHPFICQLKATFQTAERVFLITEYLPGGDLMLHLQREKFDVPRTRFYASELCLALKFLHEKGVLCRDVKLDNILLGRDGHIKVTDFGFAKDEMWRDSRTGTFTGTMEFMAPEILLDERYGHAADWWGFGTVIYQMAFFKTPWGGEDADEIFDGILGSEPSYPLGASEELVSLLQALLAKKPDERLGSGSTDAMEIMRHPWFKEVDWDGVYHKRMPPPFLPKVESDMDVSNFDTEFTSGSPTLTPVDAVLTAAMQEEFHDFSCVLDDI